MREKLGSNMKMLACLFATALTAVSAQAVTSANVDQNKNVEFPADFDKEQIKHRFDDDIICGMLRIALQQQQGKTMTKKREAEKACEAKPETSCKKLEREFENMKIDYNNKVNQYARNCGYDVETIE